MRKLLLFLFFNTVLFHVYSQQAKAIAAKTAFSIKSHRSESAVDLYRQGLRYKNGDGVAIDYTKAFQLFQAAAEMGDAQGTYATAYCYYKGLGISQDYETAARLFATGAWSGRDNSMYFMGLCFENGYGVPQNADSAKYWLGKAAATGYRQAIEELKSPKGEHSNDSAAALLYRISRSSLPQAKVLNEFTPVSPHIPSASLVYGHYTGLVASYDWSGRYLISCSPVEISFQHGAKDSAGAIRGTWQTGGGAPVQLSAVLSGDSVLFKNTSYRIRDHYSWNKDITYDFNAANLSLVRQGDSVYLSGNISMFSPGRNEPSKPMYIALVRSEELSAALKDSINAAAVKGDDGKGNSALAVIKDARVYPNPFSSDFTTEFSLTESAGVSLQLLSMNGAVVYRKPEQLLQKGKYAIVVSPGRISGGMYIIRIISGDGNAVDLKVIRK